MKYKPRLSNFEDMQDEIIDLPDEHGENVISIETSSRYKFHDVCKHHRVTVNRDYAKLECRDCKKELSPIEWISMLAEAWSRVHSLYERYKAAAQVYDEKTRTRCEHCRRVTKVRPPEKFERKLEAVQAATKSQEPK